jgi:murein DD-endopeptidase MepM/ murein hydrolase activator NlpD
VRHCNTLNILPLKLGKRIDGQSFITVRTFKFDNSLKRQDMKDRPKISISPRGQAPDRNEIKPNNGKDADWSRRLLNNLPAWTLKPSFLLAAGSLLMCLVLVIVIADRNTDSLYSGEVIPLPPNYDPASVADTFTILKEDFEIVPEVLKQDQSTDQYFLQQKIDPSIVQELVRQAAFQNIYELKKGKWLRVGYAQEGQSIPQFYEYSPNEGKYVVFQTSPPRVYVEERTIETRIESKKGFVEDSAFFNAIVEAGIDIAVIGMMEEALQWSIDLYHVQYGDKFKVVYESRFAGETQVGTGRLLAVWFETGGKEHYAYLASNSDSTGFVDQSGKPLRRTFIKSPLKYGRISSRYSLNRKHPVYGDNRPHFGTDYAAPEGTEILTVADGTVEKAEERGANGLYVKIEHGQGIATQYLHMSALGPGVRPGARVQQGQVIGYVGQTGAATGPHVCFRFWKGDKQVDHLNEELNLTTGAADLEASVAPSFVSWRDSLNTALSNAKYYGGK